MGSENFGLWLFFIASLQFFIRTQCTIVGITYVREPSVKGAGKKPDPLDQLDQLDQLDRLNGLECLI